MPQDNLFKSLTKERWQQDWWYLLAVKIVIGIFLPFFSDEAYYWVWAKNLKLSYYDHPPFISWLFYLGTPLENILFASRLPTLILGHLTIWLWCGGIAQKFSENQKRILFWLLSLHTLIGVGSLVANPDVPFLFFWSASILFYLKSIENLQSHKWPMLLGLSLGLGFSSKYLIALFAPIAFLHLIISGKWKELKWPQLFWPVILGALFSSPVWIWNYQNEWRSFKFQMNHGLGKSWRLRSTTDFVLGTSALLFPPFLYLFFKNKLFKKLSDFNVLLFLCLALFFLYSTTKGDAELNWPIAMYPSFFFILSPLIEGKKFYKSYVWFFGTIAAILVSFALISSSVSPHPRLNEGWLYKNILQQAETYQPLYTSTYQSASYFWFLSKKPYFKLRYASRPDEYDFMEQSQPKSDSFYFLKEKYQTVPKEQFEFFTFEKVTDLSNNFEVYKATKK